MADAITAQLDLGAGAGTIKLYSGTQPADADDAITSQVLLATLTFSDPSAPGASGGVWTADAITEDSLADATGTAAWARVEDSDGNNVFDCDVTATGGGGTIEINTVSIVADAAVRATSLTVTMPAGTA
jgi:hypothetical protein